MENWKVLFLGDNSTVVTTGELGKVHCYNINTLEQVHQFDTSNIFSTALAQVSTFSSSPPPYFTGGCAPPLKGWLLRADSC